METVATGESKLSPSAAGRKMKQTRLPFQVLSGSPTAAPAPSPRTPSESRKRKPSLESVVAVDALRAAKIGRTSEAKENVKAEGEPVSSVVVIDDDSVPGPPVDVDEGSNSRDLVDVRKDGKLVKMGKDEAEEEGESDKKIRTKLPMAGKKRKSVGGSEKKDKKDKKEKKKNKKSGKEGKVKGLAEGGEPIAIDDSDLSDEEEKEASKAEEKVEEAVPETQADEEIVKKDEEPTVEKPEKELKETKDKDEVVENVEEPTAEKETKTDDKLEEPSEMPKPEVTPRRARGRPSKVQKEDDKKKSPKSRRSVRVAKQEEDEKPVEEPTKEVEKPSEETSEIEKPEEEKVETKASEVESSDNSDDAKEEPSKEPEEASAKKRTRASLASNKKKSEDQEAEPKKESPEDKKPSAKGALDKFFAKVQNGTTPEKPKVVVSKPTEDKEEDDDEDEEAEPMEVGESRNNTIASICLDDSDDGENTADAEENAYMLCTPNSKDRAAGTAVDITKLTPKQMARRVEAEKKLAAKQQELEDRKRKKNEEREAKLKEKEEQERMRKKEREDKEEAKRKEKEEKEEAKRKEREEKEEAKRKEKEEKDEQKRKEREEKEKKRQAELDAKSEEKRKKDEQKEEERRKKEEEKEAEEKRKQKTAQAFQSFFVVKKGSGGGSKLSDDENSMDQSSEAGGDGSQPAQQTQAFMPFCVKGDMRLAPTCRVTLTKDRKRTLEEVLRKSGDEQGKDAVVEEDRSELWLEQIKNDKYRVGSMDRTWIAQEEDAGADDDVMIVDDDVCHQIEEDRTAVPSRRYRAKYFLFEENRRPPFRGTWRKQSANIRPRRPLALDTKFFDYEVDSDDEWEEEEPGESLHGSDDEKDVDKEEEDYEVDNDFFVPHGHLSDEELQAEDDVADDNSPEAQKAKLKIMQQEFAAEMKKKTEKIKPRLIGCLWENGGSGNGERSECSAVIWEILKARAMLFDPDEPMSFTTVRSEPDSNQSSPSKPGESNDRATERVPKAKMVKLVDEGVRELIKLIHGCAQNRSFLVKEFLAYWGKRRDEGEIVPQFAPDSIRTKILEISSWRPCPEEGPMQNKMCWYVNKEALVRFEMADLKVPTGWDFILKPIVKSKAKEKKEKETNGEEGGEGEKKTPPRKKKEEANGEEKEKKDRQSSTPSSSSKVKTAAAITKFTKKLSEDEKRKQFAKEKKKSIPNKSSEEPTSKPKTPKSIGKKTPAAASSSTSTDSQQPKKRVQLLMSVPRGQSIPQATKNNLISQFLAKPKAATSSNTDQPERMDVDEVVVLDD